MGVLPTSERRVRGNRARPACVVLGQVEAACPPGSPWRWCLCAPMCPYRLADKGTHMKTTIEISDALAREAKAMAAREKTTLRALIEAGLRQVLRDRRRRTTFRLRAAGFRGKGLQPEFRGADWQRIREAAYEERGG